jgi:hypothetical protein
MQNQPAERIPPLTKEGTELPNKGPSFQSRRGERKTLADRGRRGNSRYRRKGRKGRN